MTQPSSNKSRKRVIKNNQNQDQQKRTITQHTEIEIYEKKIEKNLRQQLFQDDSRETDVEMEEHVIWQDILAKTESGGQEKTTVKRIQQNKTKSTKNIIFTIQESHSQSQLSDSSNKSHPTSPKQNKNNNIPPRQQPPHQRQKTIQKHLHQIQQRIIKSHYPQNVMYRVFPVENKINHNHILKNYKGEENVLNCQRVPKVKQSSWSIDMGISQSPEQKHQQKLVIPSFSQQKQRFQYVQWTEQQSNVLLLNAKWIADVLFLTLRENANNSQSHVYQVRKQTLSKQAFERSCLQLKCMLRYRSIIEIVQQLQRLNSQYQQHGESILLTPLIKSSLVKISYSVLQFQNKVIQQLTKLLLSYVIEYQHASSQNKLFVSELFNNNQALTQDTKQLSDVMDKKNMTQMLQKERIFQPYKKKIRENKWRKGIEAREQTEERQRINLVMRNHNRNHNPNSDVEI